MPGTVTGMYMIVPSYRGGMNSLPMDLNIGYTAGITSRLAISAVFGKRSASRRTGLYSLTKKRDIGFSASGRSRLPRMKSVMSAGTSVTASNDDATIANVFVNASGRNMRPSCASSRNTGRNDITMIARLKKIGRPTCFAESMMTRMRSLRASSPPSERFR